MPSLIFKLRNVPDDEADDVRELLTENGIVFYETSAGNWGASMPAIWVEDDDQAAPAKDLIDDYQQQRCQQARADYQQQKLAGQHKTFLDTFIKAPLQTLFYFAAIALVLYLSAKIVLDFTA